MDDLIDAMINHDKKDDIRRRFETCSEFSIVEQWFRMEIYSFLRDRRGWSVLLVEGPYCTRAPTKSHEKPWQERLKWCDLVAMGPDGMHWFELKAIWFRQRTWKSNLNSALRDLIALAGMDSELTAKAWEEPRMDTLSYHDFLKPHAERIHKEPHHRYSICLLQGIPETLLDKENPEGIVAFSKKYLTDRSNKVTVTIDLATGRTTTREEPETEALRIAEGISPRLFDIGWVDRGTAFPEEGSRGKLAIAVWEVN